VEVDWPHSEEAHLSITDKPRLEIHKGKETEEDQRTPGSETLWQMRDNYGCVIFIRYDVMGCCDNDGESGNTLRENSHPICSFSAINGNSYVRNCLRFAGNYRKIPITIEQN
jgi:hypothetical protein